MQNLEILLVNTTFIALSISTLCYIGYATFKNIWVGRAGTAGMAVALVAATGALLIRSIVSGHPPFSNLYESAFFFAWGIILIYLVTEFWYKLRALGVVAAPVSAILIGFASLLPPNLQQATPLMPALQSYWLKIHVTIIILAYAALSVAFAAAILYLWFNRKSAREEEKSKKFAALFDDMTFRVIMIGFPLLTLGIITGAMWANEAWGTYWSWDPKEDASLVTWLVYGGYLHARLQRGWTGKKTAILAIVGFIAVIFTYLGVNFVGRGLHSYGWFL